MTKAEELEFWIEDANVGAFYIYHVGSLMFDRGIWGENEKYFVPNVEIDNVANVAYKAFQDCKVHLFQRKIHDNVYQYIAVKRSPYRRNW